MNAPLALAAAPIAVELHTIQQATRRGWHTVGNRGSREAALATAEVWHRETGAQHRIVAPDGTPTLVGEAWLLAGLTAAIAGRGCPAQLTAAHAAISSLLHTAADAREAMTEEGIPCPELDASLRDCGVYP